MQEQRESKSHKKKNEKPFLGLPGAVWMSNDLYIKFLNPANPSLDALIPSPHDAKIHA